MARSPRNQSESGAGRDRSPLADRQETLLRDAANGGEDGRRERRPDDARDEEQPVEEQVANPNAHLGSGDDQSSLAADQEAPGGSDSARGDGANVAAAGAVALEEYGRGGMETPAEPGSSTADGASEVFAAPATGVLGQDETRADASAPRGQGDTPYAAAMMSSTGVMDAANGNTIAAVSEGEPDDGIAAHAPSGDTNRRFTINTDSGGIALVDGTLPESGSANGHQVSDGTNTTSQTLTIGVTDQDEAPDSVSLSANTVTENAADGTAVGTVTASDPEGATLTYSLSDDAGGRFAIDADTGEITVADGSLLDHESTASHQVTVEVSDGTNTTSQTLTIGVTDQDEAPDSVSLSANTVTENAADGTAVGTVTASDPEGATLTYSLSDDAGGRFAIDADTGEITVADGSLLDHESTASHQVTVEVSDGTNTTSQTLTIGVTDQDEAPDSVSLSANTVTENAADGTAVGTVTASDPEGATLTYSLSDDAGGRFAIDADTGEITVADGSLLDHESTEPPVTARSPTAPTPPGP